MQKEVAEAGFLINSPITGQPVANLLLAHGAGAPMDSGFMQALAERLAGTGLRVVRFEFPYMQECRRLGKRRPPNPVLTLQACMASLVVKLAEQYSEPWFLAGKSMGGRVASMLLEESLVHAALVFGYPFHPQGKPEKLRVAHLQQLTKPLLIMQGERDPLGKRELVSELTLSQQVTINWLQAADHDFKPLKSSGFTQSQMIDQAAADAVHFIKQQLQ